MSSLLAKTVMIVAALLCGGAWAETTEIGGVVVDESGEPVAGATVSVLTMEPLTIWQSDLVTQADTGNDGMFSLTDEKGTTQSSFTFLVVQHPEYGAGWTVMNALEQRGESLSDVRIVLPPQGSVKGTVTDSAGNPVEGAVVSAFVTLPEGAAYGDAGFLPPCEALLKATSGADGAFLLDGLPLEATVILRVKHPDFAAVLAGAPEDMRGMPAGEILVGAEDMTVRLEPGATIEGRITFEQTGEAAERAVVQAKPMQYDFAAMLIGPEKTESDSAGRYMLRGLAALTYSVEVTHPEGTAAPVTVAVTAGMHVTEQDITLGRGVLVSGKLVYAETGAPVSRAQVMVMRKGARSPLQRIPIEVQPEDGTFSFREPPGEITLFSGAFTRTESRARQELTLVEGKDLTDVILAIRVPVAARGKVVGPDGEGLAGAHVRNAYSGRDAEVETAADGSFELPLPGEGTVVGYKWAVLDANHPDLPEYRGVLPLAREAAANTSAVIEMKRIGTVRGRVIDEDGNPIQSANVIAWLSLERVQTVDKSATTDKAGRYEFTDLAGGLRYRISTGAEGYGRNDVQDVVVEAGGKLNIHDMVLRLADRVIEGLVVDNDNNPLEGADVRGSGSATGLSRTNSDPEGRFRLENLADEEIRLLANYREPDGYIYGEAQAQAGDTDVTIVLLEELGQMSAEEREARRITGKEAPELNVAEWVTGEVTTMEQLRGKTIVLAFWDATHKSAVEVIETLNSLAEQHSSVTIIAVHTAAGDKDDLQEFVEKENISFHVALDKLSGSSYPGATFEKYKVRKPPAVYIIDAEGTVKFQDLALAVVKEAVERVIVGE